MIPTYISRQKSPELIQWIMAHMLRNHKGHSKAAKKDQIIRELWGITPHSKEYSSKERLFRDCLEDGVQLHEALIISSESDGYWWADSLTDGLDFAEKKMARARTILANAKKLIDNLKERYGGQIGMGL